MLSIFHKDGPITVVRNYIQKKYAKRYLGWDNEFDALFDNQTVWFVLYSHNMESIRATARLVFWNKDNELHKPLPSSQGDVLKWISPEIPRIQAEGTGLVYENKTDAYTLLYAMFSWLYEQDIDVCYSLFDINNPIISDFNTKILQFSPVSGAFVQFNTFHSIAVKMPVKWQVCVQNKQDRSVCLQKLKELGCVTNLSEDKTRKILVPV